MPKFIVAGICAITRRFAFGSSVAESRQNSLINTEACINLRNLSPTGDRFPLSFYPSAFAFVYKQALSLAANKTA
jgi:hypothetical protein